MHKEGSKNILMKTTLQSQFEQEHKAWKRSLDFFRHENTSLNYRLSEMVDSNEEVHFLQMAEFFQNKLLWKDEIWKKLVKELQELSDAFDNMQNQKNLSKELIVKQEKLRNNIFEFEKNFLSLTNEFNEKMLQSI